jgi:hypothetical protein
MIRILLLPLLALPLILVPLSLFLRSKMRQILLLTAIFGFLILGLLILTAGEIAHFPLNLTFLGTPLYLSFSRTPALLFIATLLTGLVVLAEGGWHLSRWQTILGILSLPFGFLAFFSGQFMLRYMGVEGVGLACALTAIHTMADQQPYRRFGLAFALLRLGDIGLWAAILILNQHADSLDISAMITASETLPLPEIGWALGGFLLAVMVKTAIWPFDRWLRCTRAEKNQKPHWMPAFLMPALGLYLLYRIRPILQSQTWLQISAALLALVLVLVSLAAIVFKWAAYDRFSLFNSLANAMAIFLTAFAPGAVLPFYLLGLIGFRVLLRLEPHLPALLRSLAAPLGFLFLHAGMIPSLLEVPLIVSIAWGGMTLLIAAWGLAFRTPGRVRAPAAASAITCPAWVTGGLQAMQRWEKNIWLNLAGALQSTARRLYTWMEIRLFSGGFAGTSNALMKAADWLQDGIEKGLEGLWKGLGRRLLRLSRAALHRMEDAQGDKMADFSENLIQSLDQQEQREGFRSFRWDLIWIPVFLLVMILFLFFSQKG